MVVVVFDNGDASYAQWLHDHPRGFVLNTRRRSDPEYMVLHKAACRTVSKATRQMDQNPFTGKGYIKVCAENPDALLVWIRQEGGVGFSKRCALCGA